MYGVVAGHASEQGTLAIQVANKTTMDLNVHHSGIVLEPFHRSMYSLYMQEQLFKPRQEHHELVPFVLDVPFRKKKCCKICVFGLCTYEFLRKSHANSLLGILREIPRLWGE